MEKVSNAQVLELLDNYIKESSNLLKQMIEDSITTELPFRVVSLQQLMLILIKLTLHN